MGKKFIDRTGEIFTNAYGTKMKIVEYTNVHNIVIEFQDAHKHRKPCCYNDFKRGKVRNPFDLSVQGVGFFGVGAEKTSESVKYQVWVDIFQRCYGTKRFKNHPSYAGCSVSPEWHNFQKFALWYDKNFYQVNEEEMELDKDLLVKGNKIYSSGTCVFLPARVNSLLINNRSNRGSCLLGVSTHANAYRSRCSDGAGRSIELGRFKTESEAFLAYKAFKENLIKNISLELKDSLPKNIYAALSKFKIEKTD